MASDIIKRDSNSVTTLAGVTDDANAFIKMLPIDPVTGRLKVSATGLGGGTPGGSDTQVQFNDGGSFGGDNALTWDKTSNILTLGTGASIGFTTAGTTNMTISNYTLAFNDLNTGLKVSFSAQTSVPTANRVIRLPDADGTVALTANKLSAFAATTSSELAGVISDETGSGALVFGTSPTLSSPTLNTNPVFAAGTGSILTVPTSDDTATGEITNAFNSGYSSTAIGDLVYLDSSSTWQKADADASAATYSGLLGIALEVKASGNAVKVLLRGFAYCSTAFPTFTIGSPVYMSATAGAVTQTAPTTTDSATRVLGWAVHADKMWFNPSPDYITHT